MSSSRRRFLKLGGAAGAAAMLGTIAALSEPHEFVVERIGVNLRRWASALNGVTIAQLSDIHYGQYMGHEFLAKVVDATNALNADVVAITGDFVTIPYVKAHGRVQQRAEEAHPCSELLAGLRAQTKVAVLGNHDHRTNPRLVSSCLEKNGIEVLQNRAVPIHIRGTRFWIAGVDDVLDGRPDLSQALIAVPQDEPVILLVHEPDFADTVSKFSVDLQLSGHSHGGQVRFPMIGSPVLPAMAHKYPWGLRRIGNMQLYTNRGLGTLWVPVRINCVPEVSLITLNAA